MVAQPMRANKWTIFLSHSSKDKPFADWLYVKLQSADLRVWYDKYEILVGDSVTGRVAQGLEGSEFIIAVVSQQAVKSNWVQAELEPKILQQIDEQKVTVLPIVLGKTNPGQISFLLRGKKWLRFPSKGSDEIFAELLGDIGRHLERRGFLKIGTGPALPTKQTGLQNPFGLRGGVKPERFVVPERLISSITEDIVKKQSVSVVGPRMMGKTSLLKFLSSARCQSYYQDENGQHPALRFVYLDFQEHSRKDRERLLPEVARAGSEGLPVAKRFQGNTHTQALEWIKAIAGRRRTDSQLWVLLFDEFDRVVELNDLDKTFFDELRSLPQHYNLCYVIASRRKLIDLPLPQGSNTSPFFNFLKEHFLSVWSEETAQRLMLRPRGTPLSLFVDEDFAFVTRLTAHHPLLLQIGCYHLFNARSTDGKAADIHQHVLDDYMHEAESVYRYYWDHEIDDLERGWLHDCWTALSKGDTASQHALKDDTPQRRNRTIRLQLAKLGLVLSGSDAFEFPTGVQAFLAKL
jgi:hypothetical protein